MIKIDIWMGSEKPNPLLLGVAFSKTKGNGIIADMGKVVDITNPDIEKKTKRVYEVSEERQKSTTSSKEIPPMPVRKNGENSFDYAERKNEWKKKYNQ